MQARLAILAAAAIATATALAAEPVKAPARDSVQPQPRPVEVVLASADTVHAPATADPQAAPTKRPRVARVTTCRCGDIVPQDSDQQ